MCWPATVLLALGMVIAACGGEGVRPAPVDEAGEAGTAVEQVDEHGEEAAPTADGPKLQLVATVSPIADLVAVVGGERVSVVPLVPPGADSHTYEPRPGDVVRLEAADAYVGIGLGLNDAALRLAEASMPDGAPVFRLGERALVEAELIHDHQHDHGDAAGHSHGDEAGHTHGDDAGHTHGDEAGHTHGDGGGLGPNPHVWTSLRNAASLVEGIADVLAEIDPDGATLFADNAAAYVDALTGLDARIAQAVETIPPANRTLVTYHDAWTYFARDYDLTYVAAVQPSDYREPSAAEVRAVIDVIRQHDGPALFGSEVFPSGVLDAIAEETGAVYVADLADDVLPGAPGSDEHTYLELMRRNAERIVEALGGDPSVLG